jgi:hypothetical protein
LALLARKELSDYHNKKKQMKDKQSKRSKRKKRLGQLSLKKKGGPLGLAGLMQPFPG